MEKVWTNIFGYQPTNNCYQIYIFFQFCYCEWKNIIIYFGIPSLIFYILFLFSYYSSSYNFYKNEYLFIFITKVWTIRNKTFTRKELFGCQYASYLWFKWLASDYYYYLLLETHYYFRFMWETSVVIFLTKAILYLINIWINVNKTSKTNNLFKK